MLTAAPFTTARTWKQPRWPSTDESIKKIQGCIHTMEYYSVIKRNKTGSGIDPSLSYRVKSVRKRKISCINTYV